MAGISTRLLVTVDVEADDEWSGRPTRSYRNLEALPQLQRVCDEFAARPTYLVTHDVASDADGTAIIRDLARTGRCEVGAHLHAWTTPPHVADLEGDPAARPYLSEYSVTVQRRKIVNLTRAVEAAAGAPPTSYRGGRWDVDLTCLDLLAEAGYLVDSSVTPLVSWRRAAGVTKGGPTHSTAPADPYRPSRGSLYDRGDHPVLEVPVSIGSLGWLSQATYGGLSARMEHRRILWGVVRRVLRWTGAARRVWLDPISSPAEDMIALCRRLIASGAPVLNVAFHSSELVAGCAPHVPDAQAEERIWGRLRMLLSFAAEHPSVQFAAVSEFARKRRQNRSAITDARTA